MFRMGFEAKVIAYWLKNVVGFGWLWWIYSLGEVISLISAQFMGISHRVKMSAHWYTTDKHLLHKFAIWQCSHPLI